MELTGTERRVMSAVQDGLPLVSRPYEAIGRACGLSEEEVLRTLKGLIARGIVTRFGVIVRHRALGYRANAMVVWDVPDDIASRVGAKFAGLPYVTLAYRRPRRMPDWPYNLFCMIHGRDRAMVESLIEEAARAADVADIPRAVLFSQRCFKQRGARYHTVAAE